MPSCPLDMGHLARFGVQGKNLAIEVGRFPLPSEDAVAVGSETRVDIGWAGFSGMQVLVLAVSMAH